MCVSPEDATKHIKVADGSKYDWGRVFHYQSDPLGDDEDDEKHLRRSEKEAKHDYKELEEISKRCQGGGGGWSDIYRKRP